MRELNQIRKAFPNWPSELDVAKQSGNWAMMAQSFYCASIVLYEESQKAHRYLHTKAGQNPSLDIDRRIHVGGQPATFCLAFSLELAIKAALVAQGAVSDLESNKKLPFSSHSIHELAKKVQGLSLTPEEEIILEQAASLISDGKYPSRLVPSDKKNGMPINPHFENFLHHSEPLYNRLMSIVSGSSS